MALDIAKLIEQSKTTLANVSTNRRFRFDAPVDKVFDLFRANCKHLVEERRMTFIEDEPTKMHMKMIAKWLTDSSMKPSLLLYGGLGNGKTTMSHAISDSIKSFKSSLDEYKSFSRQKYMESIEHMKTEEYWNYIALASKTCDGVREAEEAKSLLPVALKVTSAQRLADLASNKDELEKVKKYPFLIIDDLGCEPAEVKIYGTAITPVVDVIYYRYDNMLSTVITTNLDKNKIKDIYGMRVSDRIEEMCESIAFTNNSYRK